jgi:hypothetical protein
MGSAFPTGRLERLSVRLRGSVVAGESVRAGGKIVGREPRGDHELVRCEVFLEVNGRGVVLVGEAAVVVPRT